jgi:hypothetical protein
VDSGHGCHLAATAAMTIDADLHNLPGTYPDEPSHSG